MQKFKFIAVATPDPSIGEDFTGVKDEVVPDESLSLEEILSRFTRGESLEVEHEGNYDDQTEVDLEKLKSADLVDRAEYVDRLKAVQKQYEEQEAQAEASRKSAAEAEEKAAFDKKVAEAAEKLAASKV